MKEQLKTLIESEVSQSSDKTGCINEIREFLHSISPESGNPVDNVQWVPKEMVVANNYNPNTVASKELKLLYTSIKEDGYTQPIVTIWDEELGKYVIVDGFHRNLILRKYSDIDQRCHSKLPIVVIKKDIDQRMASTVRHNRARGSHSVDGMTNIVFSMMKNGKSEKEICEKLGLEDREFEKLKYITGFAKIFKNYEYSKSIEAIVRTPHEIETKKLESDEGNGD